ncbi:ABC transporter substrate-binding protein [Puerhibacterium sp. TATVAM-FAB25]|uniref:ABC transporter substrate-binding protein n=1 Tax=Puerhibacterium sp. TATVAM-FAB25 TaxID=3093699 RepID=UPI00397ADEF3
MVAALSACSSGAAAGGGGAPLDGGTIVYGHQQEPECVVGGWIEQAYLSYQVLDSLTSLGEDGAAVPWLAESWEASDDGLTWTFHLKEGVRFTDGTALTAGVVAYNFDWWVADGGNSTARAWLTPYYGSAEAVDDTTLVLHLTAPYPRLAETVAQGYFGIQSQQALETRSEAENCEAPVGSGAFVVEEWNRGQNIVLARNDDYTSWPANARHEGPAKVEKVDWRFVPDATTRTASLRSGETDAIYDVPAVEWDSVGEAGFERLRFVTPGRPQQLSFNTKQGPFTDEAVRKAFAYSLDRQQIVETIGRGLIPYEGNGAVSRSTPGYSQAAAGAYSYDPAEADRLLDEAGWTERDADGFRTKDGERLHVVLPYGAGSIVNADGAAILQGVKEQAKAVGFDVELVPVPRSELLAGAYTKPDERDLQVGYWTSVTAGILWITWRSDTPEAPNGSNGAFYADADLDALILEANSEPDVERQEELYRQAQEHIADRALSIGLYDRLSTLAVAPHLKDVWQEHAQGGPVFHDAYLVG